MTELLIRGATAADADALAAVAAVTFPLACPPGTTPEAQQEFLAEHLSAARFIEYAADETRVVLIAELAGDILGYTMLIVGEPHDVDVAGALRIRPTAELSKCYVMPGHHGAGVAAQLMASSLDAARDHGAAGIWLGVNQENARAQRFYGKSGFKRVGTKKFLVGGRWEDDYVLERALG